METLSSHASRLIYCKQYVPSSTSVNDVMAYFHKNSRAYLVVVDDDQVCGLVGRDALLMKLKSPQGSEVYGDKRISTFMDPNPLVLDCNDDLVDSYRKVISRPVETVYDDVIVSSKGIFLGTVSVKQLMVCLLQDFESKGKETRQRSVFRKPIAATLFTDASPSNDKKDDPIDAFLKALENGELEPESVAVPLPQAPSDLIKLRGGLDVFNVVELVQMLVQGRKTGRLDLLEKKKDVPFYSLYIDKGKITNAEGDGKRGKPALFKALKASEGKFIFHDNLRSVNTTIHDDPFYLLMEACRQQDEAAVAPPMPQALS